MIGGEVYALGGSYAEGFHALLAQMAVDSLRVYGITDGPIKAIEAVSPTLFQAVSSQIVPSLNAFESVTGKGIAGIPWGVKCEAADPSIKLADQQTSTPCLRGKFSTRLSPIGIST
jgi:hypothetical protein